MKNSLPWLGGIVISGLNSQFLVGGYFFSSKLISIAAYVILSMSDTMTVIALCNNSLRSIHYQYYRNISMRDLLKGYTKTI